MADTQLIGSYPSAPDRQLADLPSPGRIKVELRPLETYFNPSSSLNEAAKKYSAALKLANAAGMLTGKTNTTTNNSNSMSSSLAGSTGSSPLSSPRATGIPRCYNPEPSSPMPLEGIHRAKSCSSSATGKGGFNMQRAKSYGSIAAAAAAAKGNNHNSKQASPAPVTPDANTSNASACVSEEAAMDAFMKACAALDTLNKCSVTEIKHMKSAPAGVKLVLEAVCVLMGVKPDRVNDPQTGLVVDSYAAASKRMVTDDSFFYSLRDFDKDNISPKTLEKLRTYTCQPDMQPENVRKVSLAAHGLACWVHGMENYVKASKALTAARQEARFADYASFKSCAAPDDLPAPDTPPSNGAVNQGAASSPSRLSPSATYQPASSATVKNPSQLASGAPLESRTSLVQLLRDTFQAHSPLAGLPQKPSTSPAASPDAATADDNGPNPAAAKSSSLALAQNWPKQGSLVSPRSSAGGDSPKASGPKVQFSASALAASGGYSASRMGNVRPEGKLVLSVSEKMQLSGWALEVWALLIVAFMLSVVSKGWRPLLRLLNAMVWLVGLVTLSLAVYLWSSPAAMDWCSAL